MIFFLFSFASSRWKKTETQKETKKGKEKETHIHGGLGEDQPGGLLLSTREALVKDGVGVSLAEEQRHMRKLILLALPLPLG